MTNGYCFVIQPFDRGPFDKRYKDVFEPAIDKARLKPYRVDHDPSVSVPINEIEQGIRSAAICLADITTDNPNVWFEVGYALACQKDVVLVCSQERGSSFPFDIQHRNIVKYSTDSPSDFSDLQSKITKRLEALIAKAAGTPDLRIENNDQEKRRPWVIVDRYDSVYGEDDETGEESLVETFHIVNVGDESAVSIQIKPIQHFGRTARSLETRATLRPNHEADLRIQNLLYLLDGIRDRMPRERISSSSSLVRVPTVRLPLQVEYRDLNHTRWSTEHEVVLTGGRGIDIGIVHPDEPPEWTDLSTLAEPPQGSR